MISEYLARTCSPPAIFKPSYQPYSPPPQIEFAYRHPRLLFDENSNNNADFYRPIHRRYDSSSNCSETNCEIEIKCVDDNSVELLEPLKKNALPPPSEEATATLIGKVNSNLIKTWEQLNSRNSTSNGKSETPNQLYRVNHVTKTTTTTTCIQSDVSEDYYDSIDDDDQQFVAELNAMSMCANDDAVVAAGEVMAEFESIDKRMASCWSIESDKVMV